MLQDRRVMLGTGQDRRMMSDATHGQDRRVMLGTGQDRRRVVVERVRRRKEGF